MNKYKIVKSKKFKEWFSITKNGKVFDEPHVTIRHARNQLKRYGYKED